VISASCCRGSRPLRRARPFGSGQPGLRAADLRDRPGFGALLTIEKAIPVAAGLGGGSANAAGALALLNRFWELDWPSERLQALAARLGSDVPFALRGGTALATGTGNEVESLSPLEETWFVLLTPPWQLPEKTARLYALLQPSHYSDGGRTRALAAALARRQPLRLELLGNGFDAVAEEAFPEIKKPRAPPARGLSGQVVHLAGAGPTMFVAAPTRDVAEAWAGSLAAQGHEAYAVSTVDRGLVFFP
jgi:4-diphosphocytidyl-2-C-methyl-D-erythritol kinase